MSSRIFSDREYKPQRFGLVLNDLICIDQNASSTTVRSSVVALALREKMLHLIKVVVNFGAKYLLVVLTKEVMVATCAYKVIINNIIATFITRMVLL